MKNQDNLKVIIELLDECLDTPCTPEIVYKEESIVHRLQLLNPVIPKERVPFDKIEAIPQIKELYIKKQIKLFLYILSGNHETLLAEDNFILLNSLTFPQLILLATLSPHNLKNKKQHSNPNLLSKDRSPGVKGRLYDISWEEDFASINKELKEICINSRSHINKRYIRTFSSEGNA